MRHLGGRVAQPHGGDIACEHEHRAVLVNFRRRLKRVRVAVAIESGELFAVLLNGFAVFVHSCFNAVGYFHLVLYSVESLGIEIIISPYLHGGKLVIK